MPSVCVPWPPWSVGVRVPFHGSNQESSPPRKPAASAGWAPSTPESDVPIDDALAARVGRFPDPVGADLSMFHSGPRAAAPAAHGARLGGQRAQPLADQHPVHVGPAGQPGAHPGPPSTSIALTR